LLINALDADANGSLSVAAKRIGGPLLFRRIWERLGIAACSPSCSNRESRGRPGRGATSSRTSPKAA
jgi:hypothetical protein